MSGLMKRKSWKTTIVGVIAFIQALGTAIVYHIDEDPSTVSDWTLVVTTLILMVGLLTARDNDKKSESVGAK